MSASSVLISTAVAAASKILVSVMLFSEDALNENISALIHYLKEKEKSDNNN